MQLQAIDPSLRWGTIHAWTKEAGAVLEQTGEAILYRTKPGESARAFNAVAKAIAALSFMPGGITIFGDHWETKGGV